MFPIVRDIPYLTTEQMIEVDRAMMEDYQIILIQMMENAGRNLADLARKRFLGGDAAEKRVAVLAGTGGNGGGAMVCARRLHNWSARVTVYLTTFESVTPVPRHQLDILRRMGLDVRSAEELVSDPSPDLILDGVIGYSLNGPPRGPAKDMIEWANNSRAEVLSLDAPSGLEATTGQVCDPAIRATATMTLALPKEGLRSPGTEAVVGELYLADISVPPGLYSSPAIALEVGPIFSMSDIIRLM